MLKIVFLDAYSVGNSDMKSIAALGELVTYNNTFSDETLGRCLDADVVITNKVLLTESILSQLKQTKLICIAATGMNNVDLKAAARYGIEVKNAVDYSSFSVAQQTFAMLLSLLHQSAYYDLYVKSGQYSVSGGFTHIDRPYFQLEGKVWGVVGMGNIGKRVGRIAEAFGAEIAYFDPFAKNVPEHYKSMGIDELMSVADVVSIHSPLTPETENLINYERMCKMKPGAYIVNVARGKIVNEPDLCRALNEKRLFAAALDVFEQEPVSADNVLLTQLQEPHRFLASPHIAWSSEEARAKLIDIMTGHIKDYFKL